MPQLAFLMRGRRHDRAPFRPYVEEVMMRDFDRDWDRIERQGNWIRRAALTLIALTFVGTAALIGAAVYWGATTTPEDIGSFAGRIISGYKDAAHD